MAVSIGRVTLWDFTGGSNVSPVTGVHSTRTTMRCPNPKCDYDNIESVVICWVCGTCINTHILDVSKEHERVKKDKKPKNSGRKTRRRR